MSRKRSNSSPPSLPLLGRTQRRGKKQGLPLRRFDSTPSFALHHSIPRGHNEGHPKPTGLLYRHHPLYNPQNIRVFVLLPSHDYNAELQGFFEEQYRVSRKWFSLRMRKLTYIALSYVWGKQGSGHFVTIGNSRISITENCDQALRRIRRLRYQKLQTRNSVTPIWVDAICIDQAPEGLEERSKQVAIMGDIYGRAYSTLAWLGEDGDESRQVLDYCRQVKALRVHAKDIAVCVVTAWLRSRSEERFHSKHNRSFATAFDQLLSRPWFRRIWTFQELLLSPQPLFVYGDDVLDPDALIVTYQQWVGSPLLRTGAKRSMLVVEQLLQRVTYRTHSAGAKMAEEWKEISATIGTVLYAQAQRWFADDCDRAKLTEQDRKAIVTLVGLLKRSKSRRFSTSATIKPLPEPTSLTLLLRESQQRVATRPEDKIFALYAMARLTRGQNSWFPVPDYSAPVRKIFADATTACIETDGRCSILLAISSEQRRSDLPSWVPDYTSPLTDFASYFMLLDMQSTQLFKHQSSQKMKRSEDGMKLHIKGRSLGSIQSILEIPSDLASQVWMVPGSVVFGLTTDYKTATAPLWGCAIGVEPNDRVVLPAHTAHVVVLRQDGDNYTLVSPGYMPNLDVAELDAKDNMALEEYILK